MQILETQRLQSLTLLTSLSSNHNTLTLISEQKKEERESVIAVLDVRKRDNKF